MSNRRRERPGSLQRVASSLQQAQMREGDFRLPGDSRNRWGRVEQLFYNAGTAGLAKRLRVAPFVETPVMSEPQQFAIELRAGYTLDTLSSIVPTFVGGQDYALRVRIHRGIDIQKGAVEDIYTLQPAASDSPIASLPVGCVLAQQLGIYVELLPIATSAPLPLWVQVVVAIVNAGCAGVDGGGYPNATITRWAQDSNSALFLPADAGRKQFIVANHGDGTLYVAFAPSATPPGGSQPRWTFALPTGGSIYSSAVGGYAGPVAGVWEAAGGSDDYAMVTAGR